MKVLGYRLWGEESEEGSDAETKEKKSAPKDVDRAIADARTQLGKRLISADEYSRLITQLRGNQG